MVCLLSLKVFLIALEEGELKEASSLKNKKGGFL